MKYFNWGRVVFVLSTLSILTSCTPQSEVQPEVQSEVRIEKIGDQAVGPNTNIVVSKPMPVIVKGSFVNTNGYHLYVLQREDQPWYIQPKPAIDEINQTFTARVWFGEDSTPKNGVFTLVAIMVEDEIPLLAGPNPVDKLPDNVVTQSPMITVTRADQ